MPLLHLPLWVQLQAVSHNFQRSCPLVFTMNFAFLCTLSFVKKTTFALPNLSMKQRKRGRELERGSKPASGMDSPKWIVLEDVALTFVQSTVLRDLPVCFNGSELGRVPPAQWKESRLMRHIQWSWAGVSCLKKSVVYELLPPLS